MYIKRNIKDPSIDEFLYNKNYFDKKLLALTKFIKILLLNLSIGVYIFKVYFHIDNRYNK